MTATILLLFLVQPLLLAVWCDVRLGDRRPSGMVAVTGWMMVGLVSSALVGKPLAWAVDLVFGGRVGLDLLVILSVAILTFAFMTGIWMCRAGGGMLSTLRR